MMNCPVIIQTCDKYNKFWDGLFRFMSKNWDMSISSEIYFCNEELELNLPHGFRQILTGKGTFVENLKFILDKVGEDNVFYMLEDFWPIAPMNQDMFLYAYKFFFQKNADAMQISSYLPYYSLKTTNDNGIFEFEKDSEWIFNFQARFWKTESFSRFLTEPELSESEAKSAITVEIASDKKARSSKELSVFLLHYFWYPISGVSYRGEFTDIGHQMQNIVNIDKLVESKFS